MEDSPPRTHYRAQDDPFGKFEKCATKYNLVCKTRNPGGNLFWGPFGTPLNRRYCLPTGSKKDNEWIQLVSWKGSISKDQLIRNIQKQQLQKRLDKPPYPPMLHYKKDGDMELTSGQQVQNFEDKQLSPRLVAMQKMFFGKQKVHASPLDGPPPRTGASADATGEKPRSKSSMAKTVPPPVVDDWVSMYTKQHCVPGGRHSASAMGAPTMPPMHPRLQQLAFGTGRTMKPKLNDYQRKMWPENPPQDRCKDLGLSYDRSMPRYSIARNLTMGGSQNIDSMRDTHGREIWASSQGGEGWGN